MIKYTLAALALKGFSCSKLSKRFYRALGNSIGSKKRTKGRMPTYYFDRINRTLGLAKNYGIPKDGDKLLELGTGWLHWEAITTRLFFNVKGILYDVWDNRQLNGLKNYLDQLDTMLDELDADDAQKKQAHELITKIKKTTEYKDLYKLLGFEYVLDHKGTLNLLEKESFDYIISAEVLEHINVKHAPNFINSIGQLLIPGGYSVNSITLRDHLYAYDRAVSPKQYLKYSDLVWKLFFENDVQYINRIQRSDWLKFFQDAGLVLIEEKKDIIDLSGMKIAKDYNKFEMDDLICGGLKVLHRKPE